MTGNARIYSLYGLRVKSAISLPCPEWDRPGAGADVHLEEATEEALAAGSNSTPAREDRDDFWECREYEDGATRISWKDHFEFLVSADGGRVLWRRLTGVPDEVLFTYLLNQVLSQCLVVKGVEPLHASCVVVDGEAVALLGDSGAGKSTLAATLVHRGYPLLTDDILVLDLSGPRVIAHPSLARLKLFPQAADTVFDSRRSIPMNTFTPKMILPLQASEHVASPVPLRAIFVLPTPRDSSAIRMRRASGHRAVLALVRNTFNTSFLAPPRLKRQFLFAGRLSRAVPIRFLSYPRQMDRLPAVADALLASLSRDSGTR